MLSPICELYKHATHTTFLSFSLEKPLSLHVLRTQRVVRTQMNAGLRPTLASSRKKRLC